MDKLEEARKIIRADTDAVLGECIHDEACDQSLVERCRATRLKAPDSSQTTQLIRKRENGKT